MMRFHQVQQNRVSLRNRARTEAAHEHPPLGRRAVPIQRGREGSQAGARWKSSQSTTSGEPQVRRLQALDDPWDIPFIRQLGCDG